MASQLFKKQESRAVTRKPHGAARFSRPY